MAVRRRRSRREGEAEIISGDVVTLDLPDMAPADSPPMTTPAALSTSISDEVIRVLGVLPGASLVVGPDGAVARADRRAEALGLIRRGRVAIPQVRDLVRRVAADGTGREREMRVRRPPLGRGLLDLRVQAAPLSPGLILVLVTDLSDERRIDAVRRDFVANISHELKTPVGALSLLAEAVLSAADDPDEVRRFAGRMQIEAQRLTNLVNDIIDLSRLQSDDPLTHAVEVDIDSVVGDAVEELRTLSAARQIEILLGDDSGARVLGDRQQMLMALRNLLANALAYSPAHTRVSVTARASDGIVEVDVKDQGIGIPSHDLDRIFERFYRVDPARSRGTGGTGLGLAIVKHVCRNHGGECTVWSEVGVGSTFTLRLPTLGLASGPVAAVPAVQASTEGEPPQ